MFDAHIHLDFLESDAAISAYVQRARNAGVTGFAVPGIAPSQWPEAERVAKCAGGYWGAGVHPEHTSEPSQEAAALRAYVKKHPPDFVGEAGLDARLEATFPKEDQQALFLAHIDIAESLRRPLVVHSVRRHARVLELLEGRNVRGMIHGFIGSAETAGQFFARGWHLSAGKRAIRSPKTQQAFTSAPLDMILLESDEPGEESELPAIVDWLSVVRGESAKSITDASHRNALRLFARD